MFGTLIRRRKTEGAVPMDESALDTTLFSLSTEVPRPGDAIDGRSLDLLPMGKLVGDFVQTIIRVRALSAGGLVAEAMQPLDVGTRVAVELGALRAIPARVVWTREATLGVKFDQDADLRAVLANRAPRLGHQPRPPRLDIDCPATIKIGRYYHKTQVRDISLGGLKLAIADPSCVGQEAVVTLDSLRPIRGTVRWHRDGHAGIVFDRALAFEELAEWLGKRLEIASMRSGAWSARTH